MRVQHWRPFAALIACGGLLSSAVAAPAASSPASPPRPPAAVAPALPASAPVSLSARKVYEQARSQLVQIRTVLKGQASQTSVGSRFLVTSQGHLITNFHVVSEAALKPDRHEWCR